MFVPSLCRKKLNMTYSLRLARPKAATLSSAQKKKKKTKIKKQEQRKQNWTAHNRKKYLSNKNGSWYPVAYRNILHNGELNTLYVDINVFLFMHFAVRSAYFQTVLLSARTPGKKTWSTYCCLSRCCSILLCVGAVRIEPQHLDGRNSDRFGRWYLHLRSFRAEYRGAAARAPGSEREGLEYLHDGAGGDLPRWSHS